MFFQLKKANFALVIDVAEIKYRLDQLVARFNESGFIKNDPIQFPRRFTLLQDIEITGLIISVITWGKRSIILKSAEAILKEMENSPFEYIQNGAFRSGNESLHRTFKWNDFSDICHSLKNFYQSENSLEKLFAGPEGSLNMSDYKSCFSSGHVSSWQKGSASKRLNMFLRWMVRNDGIVDIGCWENIHPSGLFIPLDTHVARNARSWGLLTRKSNDRKSVEELTVNLRKLCPEDPVKYDFALFASTVS